MEGWRDKRMIGMAFVWRIDDTRGSVWLKAMEGSRRHVVGLEMTLQAALQRVME